MVQAATPAPPQRVTVLGVPVDRVDMAGALGAVGRMLEGDTAQTILAVNPEKIMAARRDPELLRALEAAGLLIPDGIGVTKAARLLGLGNMTRVPGSELMPEICGLAAAKGHRVFLYGARPGVAERAALILQSRYAGLTVVGTQHGYVPENGMDELVDTINRSGADILFVGLGSPRQERWLEGYRHRLAARVCQGVGGTLDAICGYPRRAPDIFIRNDLEWLYRLLSQPSRIHRQTALVTFSAHVARERLLRR